MEPLDAYLYSMKISLIDDNKVIDTYTEEFGIRSVQVTNGKFLINNKPFILKDLVSMRIRMLMDVV